MGFEANELGDKVDLARPLLCTSALGFGLQRRKRPCTGTKRQEWNVKGVWIVQHDESPHNTVLGVFADEGEELAYMEDVKDDFKNGVIVSYFRMGYRHTGRDRRYSATD